MSFNNTTLIVDDMSVGDDVIGGDHLASTVYHTVAQLHSNDSANLSDPVGAIGMAMLAHEDNFAHTYSGIFAGEQFGIISSSLADSISVAQLSGGTALNSATFKVDTNKASVKIIGDVTSSGDFYSTAGDLILTAGTIGIGTTSNTYNLHSYRDTPTATADIVIENINTGTGTAVGIRFLSDSGS